MTWRSTKPSSAWSTTAWLVDHGQAGKLPDPCTKDGRVLGVGPDKVGRAAIAGWGRQRQAMMERPSRHVQSNIRLDPALDGTIQGTVGLTLYRHDSPAEGGPAPLLVGKYADVYVKCPGGHGRFAERRLFILFGKSAADDYK